MLWCHAIMQPLAIVHFDGDGRSRPVSLNLASMSLVALQVIAPEDVCYRVDQASVPARHASLDVLQRFPPQIILQRLRCTTGTPLRQALQDEVLLSVSPDRVVPSTGRVTLRFITAHSILHGDVSAQQAVLNLR